MKKSAVVLLTLIIITVLIFAFVQLDSLNLRSGSESEPGSEFEVKSAPNSEEFNESAQNTLKKTGLYGQKCEGSGPVKLTSPININDLELIVPMGRMSGSHVTPTDHQYWQPKGFQHSSPKNEEINFDIFAPADGNIVRIEKFSENDYRIDIEHTCTFYTYFIHLNELSDKIINQYSGERYESTRIPIQKGEVIGRKNYLSFDFAVIDTETTLPGFITPEYYEPEPWKIHTVDPFNYFEDSIKQALLQKNLRKVEPYGGKIDYDIQGKLVGNWFKEGTGGYRNIENPEKYWSSHLSFAYNHIDPSHIVISIGNFNGESKKFGVKENSPDPEDIDISSGLVKYELVKYDYKAGSDWWNRISYQENLKAENLEQVEGTLLVQLMENEKLKVEAFPGKTADQLNGFKSPVIYER